MIESLSQSSAAVSILYAFALGYNFCRKIGGYTGDILGAVCEITEIIPVLCLISVLSKQI